MKIRVLVQSKGEVRELGHHGEVCVVGRHGADIDLADGDASRRHAAFYQDGRGQLRVKDLGSLNGTIVGGRRVVDVPLEVGSRIEIGSATLVLVAFTPLVPPPLPSRR